MVRDFMTLLIALVYLLFCFLDGVLVVVTAGVLLDIPEPVKEGKLALILLLVFCAIVAKVVGGIFQVLGTNRYAADKQKEAPIFNKVNLNPTHWRKP